MSTQITAADLRCALDRIRDALVHVKQVYTESSVERGVRHRIGRNIKLFLENTFAIAEVVLHSRSGDLCIDVR